MSAAQSTSANYTPSSVIVSQPLTAQSANEKSNLVITHNNGDSTRCSCCSMTTFHCTILSGGIGAIFFAAVPVALWPPASAGCITGWAVTGGVCGGAVGACIGCLMNKK